MKGIGAPSQKFPLPKPMTGDNASDGILLFPNGCILKWESNSIGPSTTKDVAHGLTKCFRVFTQIHEHANVSHQIQVGAINDTNFHLKNNAAYTYDFTWFAVGR